MNSRCFQTLKPFCLLKVLGLSLLFIAVSQGRADPLPSDIFGALPMLKTCNCPQMVRRLRRWVCKKGVQFWLSLNLELKNLRPSRV